MIPIDGDSLDKFDIDRTLATFKFANTQKKFLSIKENHVEVSETHNLKATRAIDAFIRGHPIKNTYY